MTGKTHLAGGVAAAVVVERSAWLAGWPLLPPEKQAVILGWLAPVALLAFAAAALGSLLPDLDEPNSLVSNLPRASRGLVRGALRTKGVEGVARSLVEFGLLLVNFVTRFLSRIVRMAALGHRGATHWLVTALALALLAALGGWFIGFPALGAWLFIGYGSHLALDAMTLSGLELLQPFTARKVHLLPKPMRIRTGSLVDSLLTVVFGAVAATAVLGVMAAGQWPQLWRLLAG
ncbi:MAG: hypothetical protein FOGNACKC_05493 [Anaerolineae bacterium]|nr:hypothetical protein [Anaerolineae bacterium]